MTMDGSAAVQESGRFEALLRAFDMTAPATAHVIREFGDQPLRSYAAQLLRPVAPPADEVACWARRLLAKTLKEGDPEFSEAAFMENPVLHTAAHCQLACDPLTFSSLVLYHLGISRCEWRVQPAVYLCSTNSLQARSRLGPNWLQAYGRTWSALSIPSSLLKTSVIGLRREGIRFSIRPADGLQDDEPDRIQKLREQLKDLSGDNPASLYLAANQRILAGFDPQFSIFSDSIVASIAARHLDEPDSPLSRLLCHRGTREALLSELARRRNENFGKFLPWGTDFFWEVSDHSCRSMTIQGDCIVSKNRRTPLEPRTLVEELRTGTIVPNLLVTFAVLAILPQSRVLGGHRQAYYYPTYHNVINKVLGRDNPANPPDHGWVMGPLDLQENVLELLADMDRLSAIGDRMSLQEAMGEIGLLDEDKAWVGTMLKPSTPCRARN